VKKRAMPYLMSRIAIIHEQHSDAPAKQRLSALPQATFTAGEEAISMGAMFSRQVSKDHDTTNQ
jgi:hypothetical protein